MEAITNNATILVYDPIIIKITPQSPIHKSILIANFLPFLSLKKFMRIKPINEPIGKADCMTFLYASLSQYNYAYATIV